MKKKRTASGGLHRSLILTAPPDASKKMKGNRKMFQPQNRCSCCGNPVDDETAEQNDGLCQECAADFDECVLDLSIDKEIKDLSDWQFERQLRWIGWEYHRDPEYVRQLVWEIEG